MQGLRLRRLDGDDNAASGHIVYIERAWFEAMPESHHGQAIISYAGLVQQDEHEENVANVVRWK